MWLFVHGFTGAPQSWSIDSQRAVAAPWLFGHGHAWKERGVASFDDEVSRLAELAAEHARPRLLCGYSLGARLGLGALVAHPDLFDGAVLVGVHPGLEDDDARAARRRSDADLAARLRTDGLEAFVRHWESLPLFETQRALPAAARERQRSIRLGHTPEGLARSLEVLGLAEMRSYWSSIGAIQCPVTLVAGSLDSKFSKLAWTLAAGMSQFDVEVVQGVGHNVVLEAPDAIGRILERSSKRVLA